MNKLNLYILISALLLFSLNSLAQKCISTSKYFTVDSTLKSVTHGGPFGSGSSCTYQIFITIKKNKIQYFDSAWAHNSGNITIMAMTDGEKAGFKKKYHYMIEFTVHYNQEPEIINGKSTFVLKPMNCQEEVIIRYKAKRKKYFITLSQFIIQPTLYMP